MIGKGRERGKGRGGRADQPNHLPIPKQLIFWGKDKRSRKKCIPIHKYTSCDMKPTDVDL